VEKHHSQYLKGYLTDALLIILVMGVLRTVGTNRDPRSPCHAQAVGEGCST